MSETTEQVIETAEQVLARFVRIGGLDGTPDPMSIVGSYGELRNGNILTRESSLQDKKIGFECGPVGTILKDGTYYADDNVQTMLSSLFVKREQGKPLTMRPSDDARMEFTLTDICTYEMINVKEKLLAKLEEANILGLPLPEFFNENNICMFTGVVWGTGKWKIVNTNPGESYGEVNAEHIILGVSYMRYNCSLLLQIKPVFHPNQNETT